MSENRRRSFRCASAGGSGTAVLRIGRKDSTVDLLDQSAEGFAVAGPRLRGDIGQRILLRTARGWSEAEVVRRDEEGSRVTLGLRHLQDLPDPRMLRHIARNGPLWRRSGTPVGSWLHVLLLAGMGLALSFWAALMAAARLGTH